MEDEDHTEEIPSDELPDEPLPPPESLVGVLSASETSGWSSKETKLYNAYKSYLDKYFEMNILRTQDIIVTDYRVVALTLEFIAAAAKDVGQLSGKNKLTLEIATITSIWLLTRYTQEPSHVAFAFPHNVSLLIKVFYDIVAKKYAFENVLPEKEMKKRTSLLGRYKFRFSTLRMRWTTQS
jgi:hypothetical protein